MNNGYNQNLFNFLRESGFEGQFNQMQVDFLKSLGYSGQLNIMWKEYLADEGHTGNFNKEMNEFARTIVASSGPVISGTSGEIEYAMSNWNWLWQTLTDTLGGTMYVYAVNTPPASTPSVATMKDPNGDGTSQEGEKWMNATVSTLAQTFRNDGNYSPQDGSLWHWYAYQEDADGNGSNVYNLDP